MKKILVTGGAGFIGSNLIGRLLPLGYEVICLDNLSSGSLKNIEEFMGHGHFQFVEGDVTVPFRNDVDFIYNLACPASPVSYQSDPIQTMKTSILGTMNILDLACACGAKVLQASTSEVYGDPDVHPQGEKYWGNVNPMGVRSCYDEGKRAAESLCFDYYRQRGVDVRVVRIFNTYGQKMAVNDGRAVSNFVVQALRGDDIIIYGDGKQTRSFCYIEDMLDGFLTVINYEGKFLGPVNLGNQEEVSIFELACLVKKLTGSESPIVHVKALGDDPLRRKPLLDLVKDTFSWEAKVSLREGLEDIIRYFRKQVMV
ncbi:MAG: UDP-glucuronate decarboxylase [Chlamydiales bacterium]|jgi:UDP-glucuronate decarboxylase